MSGKAFLDTNILLYCFDNADSRKQELARHLVNSLLDVDSARISTQTLQEYYNVITKKLKCDKKEALKNVERYSEIFPVHTNTVKDILSAISISVKPETGASRDRITRYLEKHNIQTRLLFTAKACPLSL